jgi:hypothetical protein
VRVTDEVECAWSWEHVRIGRHLSQFSHSGSRGSRKVGQRRATCPCNPCIVQRYQDCELKVFPPPVVRNIVWSKASIIKAVRRIQKRFRQRRRHCARWRRMHFARSKAAIMIQRRVQKRLRKHLDTVDVARKKKRKPLNESDLSPKEDAQSRKKRGAVAVARKKKRKPLNESDLSPMEDAQPRKKSKRPGGPDRQQPVQTNHTVTTVGGIIPRPPEDSEKHCGLCFGTFPQRCERSRATARCGCDYCKWIQCAHCQRYFHNSCRLGIHKSQFRTRKKKLVCYACLECGMCGEVLSAGATQVQLLTPARRFVHPQCLT